MKNARIIKKIILLGVLAAAVIGFYFFETKTFDDPTPFGFPEPQASRWFEARRTQDAGTYAMHISQYVNNYDDMSFFPYTKNGILNLRCFITMLWLLKPSSDETSGDIEIRYDSVLYNRIKLFFPDVEKDRGDSYPSICKIFRRIVAQEPSRFRFFLYRMGLVTEEASK